MSIEELMERLELDEISDMEYAESFCGLMEMDEDVEEDVFYKLFSEISFDAVKELTNNYLDEIVASVPDDCIEFYTFLSSYKRNFRGLLNYCCDEENMNEIISELYRFREWYLDPEKVQCSDMVENRDFLSSICEALVLGRMERLSMGSYSFDFGNALDFHYEDYEDYADKGESGYIDDIDDYYENEDNDPNVTLIDRINPVIDGVDYDNDGGEFLL